VRMGTRLFRLLWVSRSWGPERIPTPESTDSIVVDTSEVAARKADAQMKVISSLAFKGTAPARSIRCRSRSRKAVTHLRRRENGQRRRGGAVQGFTAGHVQCRLTPFPWDGSSTSATRPSRSWFQLGLETHELANCSKVIPDTVGEGILTLRQPFLQRRQSRERYSARVRYWQSGVRVFDIRNPAKPKEIGVLQFRPCRCRERVGRRRPETQARQFLGSARGLRLRAQAADDDVQP